jgi:hypothetical protein
MIRHPKVSPSWDVNEPGEPLKNIDFVPCSQTGQQYPGTYYADCDYSFMAIWGLLKWDLCLECYQYYTGEPQLKKIEIRSGIYGERHW